jgi:hypothetical protein
MKLAIFGSRSIKDNRVKIEIADFLNEHPDFNMLVTTQEPKGVCAVTQVYAKENSIPLELHFLNIKKYARGAFEHRSDEAIQSADFVLLIHDGESQGTKNELARVKKFAKPYKYVKLGKSTELEREENNDILKENRHKEKQKKYDFFDL